jgi:hypothetical protein
MKKYLSIKLAGHNFVAAFKNEKKEKNQPDFKGDGVAVWIQEYDETKKKPQETKVEDVI